MADSGRSSKKKADKKARRAAKVQQKESNTPSTAGDVSSSAAASSTSGSASQTSTPTSGSTPVAPQVTPTAPSSAQKGEKNKNSADAKSNSERTEKKQLTKAERRALQEAQRKAKEEKKKGDKPKVDEPTSNAVVKVTPKTNNTSTPTSEAKPPKTPKHFSTPLKAGNFLSHLPVYREEPPPPRRYVHPAIAQVGLQYAKGVIRGSNARAVALLCSLKKMIEDYETPPQKDLSRDLLEQLKWYMDYLNSCRPISVSMESVGKYISPIIMACHRPEQQAKEHLCSELDRFYRERLHASDVEIVKKTVDKIVDNDVIVTYGHSSLVLKVLISAVSSRSKLSVIIVDSRPMFEGREMMRKLIRACPTVKCSYVLIDAVSYIMPRASKVLMGAHAVLANGYIMSRVGTSQLALMAKAYNVPFLVCSETYKFSPRMQTDSFVCNELGDEASMMNIDGKPGPLTSLDNKTNLQVLNFRYDVTPPDYVTGLITETGVIPCTSAPVVMRVKQQFDLNIKT